MECAWNGAIRDGVAEAFANAVASFAKKDHPLRYSWLEFLPAEPMEKLWEPLYSKIRNFLMEKPILQTWTGREFKRPSELIFLMPSALHDGKPIFDDLTVEQYLAPEYGKENEEVLEELGVMWMDWSHIIKRLEADLTSPHSKTKSLPPDDKWHTPAADLILEAFDNPETTWAQQSIKEMAIIPQWNISELKWIKAPQGFESHDQVYFQSTDGIPVPYFLLLTFVDRQSASVPARAALFRKLGVQDCPKEIAIEKILERHQYLKKAEPCWKRSWLAREAEYEYLFHFHTDPELLKTYLWFPTESENMRLASDHLYFLSDEQYNTQKLLGGGCEKEEKGYAAFITKRLLDFVSPATRSQNLSWIQWLEMVSGARYFPPLVDSVSASELSPVMVEVLERNPEKIVEILQAHWDSEYRFTTQQHSWLPSKLGDCTSLCESAERCELKNTYLPTNEIKMEVKELGLEKFFPVLKLPVALNDENYRRWQFLEDLGVGHRVDLEFYKHVMAIIISFADDFAQKNVAAVYIRIKNIAQGSQWDELR